MTKKKITAWVIASALCGFAVNAVCQTPIKPKVCYRYSIATDGSICCISDTSADCCIL